MDCEICHKKKAVKAVEKSDEGEELYLCDECAKKEIAKRKSMRESRPSSDSASSSEGDVKGDGGDPKIFRSLVEAVSDMFTTIGNLAISQAKSAGEEKKKDESEKYELLDVKDDSPCIWNKFLHLEALHLLGELEAAQRAAEALDMRLVGIECAGIPDTGHMFSIGYKSNPQRAELFLAELLKAEQNARERLLIHHPRYFCDSASRALAVLKNCHLLSNAEYFDLLSTLRLAAMQDWLVGLKLDKIDEILAKIELFKDDSSLDDYHRDAIEGKAADLINEKFAKVRFNKTFESYLVS